MISRRIGEIGEIVKTGRTHLMDAMPVTFGQEMSGWRAQIDHGSARIMECRARLQAIALGGTAVGTGINAHPRFAARAARYLSVKSGLELRPSAELLRVAVVAGHSRRAVGSAAARWRCR